MRLLIFNFEYPPLGGGGGVATKYIAEELAKKHEVHVITSRPSKTIKNKRQPRKRGGTPVVNGVRIHRVPVLGRRNLAVASLTSLITFVPSAWWKARQLVKERQFDVINAQFVLPSGVPAALIARQQRIPMVLSFIGGDLFDPTKGVSPHRHWLLRKAIKIIADGAEACTAISHDTKRRAVEIHRVKQSIEVINLGIRPSQHSGRKTRTQLGLPEGVKLFISVGRLIPRKGYHCLLEALALVNGAHLGIIGEGPLLDSLKQSAYELGVHERVHWLGYVSERDKINILDQCDAFISASEHEGFGIVFLEAMECGCPIIATWEGGQTDFLAQGTNAILVRPKQCQDMAQAMKKIIEEPELARRMATINREKVKSFYWPQVVQKYEAVFETVIKEFNKPEKYEGGN